MKHYIIVKFTEGTDFHALEKPVRGIFEQARLAEKRMKEKAAAARREQEEMKKHRKEMMTRAAIIFIVLSVLILIFLTLALKHGL